MVKQIKAVLFDFDGVLIDSIPVMKLAWSSVESKYKIQNNFEEFRQYIGIPFPEILEKLSINKPIRNSITKHYSKISSNNKDKIILRSEVQLIIKKLNSIGIKIGIVTSKDELRTKELINFFQLNIPFIVTPEKTDRGKPFPDPLLYSAEKLSLNLNEILFIGDMCSDMLCAQNAKTLYLHYLEGYQKLELQTYGGEINSLLQIEEYINYI